MSVVENIEHVESYLESCRKEFSKEVARVKESSIVLIDSLRSSCYGIEIKETYEKELEKRVVLLFKLHGNGAFDSFRNSVEILCKLIDSEFLELQKGLRSDSLLSGSGSFHKIDEKYKKNLMKKCEFEMNVAKKEKESSVVNNNVFNGNINGFCNMGMISESIVNIDVNNIRQEDMKKAFKEFLKEVHKLPSSEISDETRNQIFEHLGLVAQEVALPVEKQRKSVLSTVSAKLSLIVGTISSLKYIWEDVQSFLSIL